MAQELVPVVQLDRGVGQNDLQASLVAASEVELNVPNDGKTAVYIDNQSAGVRTATLQAVPDPFGRSVDVVIAIPAGEMGRFGRANRAMFGPVLKITLDAFATTNVGAISEIIT